MNKKKEKKKDCRNCSHAQVCVYFRNIAKFLFSEGGEKPPINPYRIAELCEFYDTELRIVINDSPQPKDNEVPSNIDDARSDLFKP